jgi:2-succinyl-5-enolpyruvyl-6-hydroxy-3-cyclohexene-1-carboxylate synthase
MKLDFRNINTLWCSIIAEILSQLGLKNAIICPGSRSSPLTVAFVQHPQIQTIPILDERSASFFALGIAKKSGIPTALICTSGTAGANFYPAVIEAKYSKIPLLIFTADRPPQLRNCHAGQTIDQVKLYGNYPNFYTELATPSPDLEILFYLRQNIIQAWERTQIPTPGVVHLNIPFDEPLAPITQKEIERLEDNLLEEQLFKNIEFKSLNYQTCLLSKIQGNNKETLFSFPSSLFPLQKGDKGIIIAGVDHSYQPEEYCRAIAFLSQLLQFPVLAEALSPVRNYAHLNCNLVYYYDLILRDLQLGEELKPEIVILIGEFPTSKQLREWLNKFKPKTYIIGENYDNLDAIHTNSIHLRVKIENLVNYCEVNQGNNDSLYLDKWLKIEAKAREKINLEMNKIEQKIEGKVAWILSETLPKETPIFIANSMSVRYAEFFWQKNDLKIQPYFNRGANGIDGTLSTALGIAHENKQSILLTGDLAFLHDLNGLLIRKYFQGSLTIILINNNGGGIFQMLPIAEFNPPFEEYFATPQDIDFRQVCVTYGMEYVLIDHWEQLRNELNCLLDQGIKLLEIKCDRAFDSLWLKDFLSQNFDS